MEDAAPETEFASGLLSLRDIVAEIYERGLDCTLNDEQLLRLKVVIEKFERINFSRERLYIILEQVDLSLEDFTRLLHAYSIYWKRNERNALVGEANSYRVKH